MLKLIEVLLFTFFVLCTHMNLPVYKYEIIHTFAYFYMLDTFIAITNGHL